MFYAANSEEADHEIRFEKLELQERGIVSKTQGEEQQYRVGKSGKGVDVENC